jgi:hypothetical protein
MKRHGMKGTPTWLKWKGMKDRCRYSSTKHHTGRYHKEKGITFCDRWLSFENFLADMGLCPTGYQLDRFPNRQGNYEPGNCRWATPRQNSNNKSNNKLLTHLGETKTQAEWARSINLNEDTLKSRLSNGWTVEDALTIPVRGIKL